MSETAVKQAYEHIRNAIFSREFPPGFHLREEEFSETLNMSRTPVRQAIRQLATEGLVDIKENRRSYVTDVADEDIDLIFDLVAILESYSVRRAAERITSEQLEELKQIEDDLEAADPEDDSSFLNANARFHNLLHDASGSRLLRKLVDLVISYPMLFYLKAGVHTENETAAKEHREIIDALINGTPDYAALKMRIHTETVRNQYKNVQQISQSDDR
ncbi:MAG: GntR family transcriptional regulator [Pseudomonadota bacterium]